MMMATVNLEFSSEIKDVYTDVEGPISTLFSQYATNSLSHRFIVSIHLYRN